MSIEINDSNLSQYLSDEALNEIATHFSKGEFETITTSLLTEDIIKTVNDDISKQIILSVYLYSLLKLKRVNEAKKIDTSFSPKNGLIFPFLFLKAKILIYCGDYKNAIELLSDMKKRYDAYQSNDTKDVNDIIYIETNKSSFKYFSNVFVYLFGINNIDIKIKKIYFELSHLLSSLSFSVESYSLIDQLYQKYPTDIVILFSYAKMSILHSHSVNYTKALTQMKKIKEDNSTNPSMKSIIENYIDYSTSLELLSKGEYEKAESSMLNIGGRLPNNAMLVNNIAVLDILSNKVDDGYNAMLNVV